MMQNIVPDEAKITFTAEDTEDAEERLVRKNKL